MSPDRNERTRVDSLDVFVGAAAVLLGALIAGGFSLLIPHLQTRRDHQRWLRESRLDAYGEYLASIDLWMEASTTRWLEHRLGGDAGMDRGAYALRLSELEDAVARSQSRVYLVGPDPVRIVAAEYHHAVLNRIEATEAADSLDAAAQIDLEPLREARGLLLGVMNRVLGISPV